MKSYEEFTRRYELNPNAPDSREQYRQYKEALATLMAIAPPKHDILKRACILTAKHGRTTKSGIKLC